MEYKAIRTVIKKHIWPLWNWLDTSEDYLINADWMLITFFSVNIGNANHEMGF